MLHKDNWLPVSTGLLRKYLGRLFDYSWLLKQVPVILAVVFLLLFTTRCQKDTVTTPPAETNVHFIGHKGGGNNAFNPLHIENTLPSVQDGLKTMNGVEVDVQMSLDGTIWLFHHADIGESSCDTKYHHTIALLKDSEIQKVQICSGTKQSRIYKLEELINFWNADPAGFYLSMHVKLDLPADSMNKPAIGGEAAYLSKFAASLAKIFITVNHQNQLFLEVYDATFCKKIHATIPAIKVCLLKEVTFPKQISDALALGYDGVSCNFLEPTVTADEVQRAKDNGLVVHMWTPDTADELKKAFDFKPSFIQTNNLDAISLLNVKVIP